MIDTHTVKMLAQYKAWADKVMFDGVAALPPGEAEKERKTLFKSITPRARLLRAQPHAAFRIAGALGCTAEDKQLVHRLGRSAEPGVA
jgi:uncharacterized damage-inducible protein DinB